MDRLSGTQFLLALPYSARQRKIGGERPRLSEDEFIHLVGASGGDRDAALAILEYLRDWIYVNGFTPYPNDSLSHTFGIAEEELDEDLILGVMEKSGLSIVDAEKLPLAGKVDTPMQVAILIAEMKSRRR